MSLTPVMKDHRVLRLPSTICATPSCDCYQTRTDGQRQSEKDNESNRHVRERKFVYIDVLTFVRVGVKTGHFRMERRTESSLQRRRHLGSYSQVTLQSHGRRPELLVNQPTRGCEILLPQIVSRIEGTTRHLFTHLPTTRSFDPIRSFHREQKSRR